MLKALLLCLRLPRLSLFLPAALSTPNDSGLPIATAPLTGRRPLAICAATLAAALLHGGLLFWYAHRPAPLPFAAAAPLPMIDMMLSAPPAPAVTQPVTPPTPLPAKVSPKADPKPIKKPKPKPKAMPSETKVKQVTEQKVEADSAPPPAAPVAENHERAAAPRNDVYIPANSDANYLNNPKPVYPMVARQRHWEGLVMLRVYITADGHAAQVVVQRSSGHEQLDEAALEAVKNWRFIPAKRGEFAEASWANVPIDFSLQ